MLDSGTIEDYISPELNDKLTKFAEEHPMFTYQQFSHFPSCWDFVPIHL